MHASLPLSCSRARSILAAAAGLALVSCPGGGGGGTPLFAKSYGGDGVDYAADAVATPDGGYVFVGGRNGRTLDGELVEEDLWVTKVDAYGDVEWSNVYSDSLVDVGVAADEHTYRIATERRGGGFYLVGTVDSVGPIGGFVDTPEDVGVTRLDANGDVLWAERYGFTGMPLYPLLDPAYPPAEEPLAAWPTEDGGLLVVGLCVAQVQVAGSGVSLPMPFAMRIDDTGFVEWQTQLSSDGYEVAGLEEGTMFVQETSDPGAIVVVSGEFDPDGIGAPDGVDATRVFRLDSFGDELWSRRIDEVHVEDLCVFDSAGGIDSVLLAVVEYDDWSLRDAELILLDGNGDDVAREDVSSDIDAIDVAAAQPLIGTTSDVVLAAGQPTIAAFDVRAGLYDGGLGSLSFSDHAGLWSVFRIRPVATGVHGFEMLAAGGPDYLHGTLTRLRIDPAGSVLEETELPIPVSPSFSRRYSRGLVPAGWVDGSTDLWTWTPIVRDDPTAGFVLSVHDDSGVLWSRTFSGTLERRVERAVAVELQFDPFDPSEPKPWNLVVLGEIAYDPVTIPPPPGTELSPWVLRLSPDGAVLGQRVFHGVKLPSASSASTAEAFLGSVANELGGRSAQQLAIAPDGRVVFAIEAGTQQSLLQTTPDLAVAGIVGPIVPEGYPIACLASTANGDVLVAGPRYVARISFAGFPEAVWLKETLPVSSVCELADGTIALGFAFPVSFGATAYGVVHLEADGSPIDTVFLDNPDVGLHSGETHVLPRADGGLWLAVQMRIPYTSLVGGFLPPGSWVQQIVAFDATVTPEWSQTYGGLLDETIGGFRAANDGGLVLAGNSSSLADSPEAWLLRLDSKGRISPTCAAAIAYHERIGGVHDASNPASTDATIDVPGTFGGFTPHTTNAIAVSVKDELELARQCSGKAHEDPREELALLQVVIAAGSGQVVELTTGTPLIDCPTTCEALVPVGTTLDLVATPAAGFDAPTWTGTDCGATPSSQCSVTVTDDQVVTVGFPTSGGPELYDLTVVFAGAGSGTVSFDPIGGLCSDTCTQVDVATSGQQININAAPDPGSSFGGWTGADLEDGTFCSVLFTDSDRTVTVTFD